MDEVDKESINKSETDYFCEVKKDRPVKKHVRREQLFHCDVKNCTTYAKRGFYRQVLNFHH